MWGVFRGPEGPRFHRNYESPEPQRQNVSRLRRSDRRVPILTRTPTADAFTGTHGEIPPLVATAIRSGHPLRNSRQRERETETETACRGPVGLGYAENGCQFWRAQARVPVPQNLTCLFSFQRAMRRSSREPGRTQRPTDLPDSSAKPKGGRHREPCHRGQKLPRLTLIHFGIAVYCGNYACW
jgi:hypothetical protein